MKKILVVNGPNLNMLGQRDVQQYGDLTLDKINQLLEKEAGDQAELQFFQSNHEGRLIDFLQDEAEECAGILINPGALTHYSVALLDALLDTGKPFVEVHLSDISQREDFRQRSLFEKFAAKQFKGEKEESYLAGLRFLLKA
ncbi:MAG: 3-dehydroquinate dehydratase [Parcubacteria group bacterium]|nr:3-dehydroquinate dehydratase [Parcubacteria group bacterium]